MPLPSLPNKLCYEGLSQKVLAKGSLNTSNSLPAISKSYSRRKEQAPGAKAAAAAQREHGQHKSVPSATNSRFETSGMDAAYL